jgi:predicted dehydrogenase
LDLKKEESMDRRQFVSTMALGAAAYSRVLGANERINVGIIGAGGQGRGDWGRFIKQPEVNPVAVCDVYKPHLEKGLAMANGRAQGYKDFRKLLERKDVDAVIVATPDHWHALPTIMACQAGKDVYVEKPLALTIQEGRAVVNAARKYQRVVQTGSQQRSGEHYARAVELVRGGKLGKIAHITAGHIRNSMPGFGRYQDEPPPPELDWDMWLGPAPYRPYNKLRCTYNFRWFWDYSGGQMTNWGAHNLDIARWAMNVRSPISVAAFGGRFALDDGGETPDVQEVIYQFPGFVLTWSVREVNGMSSGGFDFHGTKGNLSLSRGGFKVTAEKWATTDDAEETGKKKKVDKDDKKKMTEEMTDPGSEQPVAHVRNFLDCVKSRKRPNADVEEGHLSAILCHLGNIATRLGRSLKWDAEKEEIVGDGDANRWLSKEYRKPWVLPV